MSSPVESVRDFVLQLDKTLSTRRLYASHSAAHADAAEVLHRKCAKATETGEVTLEFGPTDLLYQGQSLLSKTRREDAFFFPLFRDGVRSLTFLPNVSLSDLNTLLGLLQIKHRAI